MKEGDQVEVAQIEEGFEGSHYEARVLAPCQQGHVYIEYVAFADDSEEGDCQLREWALASRLRPMPPRAPEGWMQNAPPHYAMDMLFEDGWWQVTLLQLPPVHDPTTPDPYVEVHCANFDNNQRLPLSSLRPPGPLSDINIRT